MTESSQQAFGRWRRDALPKIAFLVLSAVELTLRRRRCPTVGGPRALWMRCEPRNTLRPLGFMREWSKVERSYRRPFSRIVSRLKFRLLPACSPRARSTGCVGREPRRSLEQAENAIFDYVITWRRSSPSPPARSPWSRSTSARSSTSGRAAKGGWPWSRQRHADLLDQLDRAGAAVVGYDVLFSDPSQDDPSAIRFLEAMAGAAAALHLRLDPAAPGL